MRDLVRTEVSLERDLLTQFDVVIEEKGYQNRSGAIRDLIRRQRGNSHESRDLQLPANDETHRKKTSP